MERHILREGTSSHIFFRDPGSANACTPLQAETPLIGRVSLARLRFSALCKSGCVVLIMSSPSGYTSVRPECPDVIFQFTNQNVTACQSIWGHLERSENPCHKLYNTTFYTLLLCLFFAEYLFLSVCVCIVYILSIAGLNFSMKLFFLWFKI